MILLVLGWVVVLRQRVEEQTKALRQSEERFRYMAQHDPLTGLPTRLLLNERLDTALSIKAAASTRGKDLALLMIDIDDFKGINDSLGHDAGDETLCITARRMIDSVRKTDMVARLGGDEFIVLLDGLLDIREAETIAGKLVDALSCPVRLCDRDVPVSVSVGVYSVPADCLDASRLLKCVDQAMYQAKANGKHCLHLFSQEMTYS